jgi:glycosyltransferase involved in cell wall biosynthesis
MKREKSILANEVYFSVCLPVHNMENYISRSLLSVINQSFQNFEIILVNDDSNDNTKEIINKYQLIDERIKLINHLKNLGVYRSRIDAVLQAKGKYILLLDPDDMILNPNLLESLYRYNMHLNLDIIEFVVFNKNDWERKIFFPKDERFNHFHNYNKNIIYQPDLSNILFYSPNTNNIVSVHCRTVWNKIVRKTIMFKTINYLEKIFHGQFLISADDTPINIMNFQFSQNYSNINLPGYLYIKRKNSSSMFGVNTNQNDILFYNYFIYYKFFYKYIQEFNKKDEFILEDLKTGINNILQLKNPHKEEVIEFFNEALNNTKSFDLKNQLIKILVQIKKKH